jgi:ATP-dependent helicase/nuclease subunit B
MRAALAGLRGQITLSYATGGAGDGAESGPSLLLLEAFRVVNRDKSSSYADLRRALQPVIGAVSTRADGPLELDARDVWLGALARGSLLLDGEAAVRQAFPMLDAGLRAAAIARGDQLSEFSGLLPQLGESLDPAANGIIMSASGLELLSRCPLAWFYRYAVKLRPPDDTTYDSGRWLDHTQRGALLHEVYESFCGAWQGRQLDILDDSARDSMRSIVNQAIQRWRDVVAPPGETVFDAECTELHIAGMMFLEMERDAVRDGAESRWLYLESAFGYDGAAVHYDAADGARIRIGGRIDRVDELPGNGLVVIDYKTGASTRFSRVSRQAEFNGGRQLQPAVYAAAAEELFERDVARFEYRFPTERGQAERISYERDELDAARQIIAGMAQDIRAGAFMPTTDSADCKFCDFGAICRVNADENVRKPHSPRAEWAAKHSPALGPYRNMLRRRAKGGGEDDGER